MRSVTQLELDPESRAVPLLCHDKGNGATLAITANVHGDEVTGVAAVHHLDGWLGRNLLRGKVVLLPSANPRGLATGDRRFGGRDMNRCFPGSARGGVANQAAAKLWKVLGRQQLDAAIDLHADSPSAAPYALVDRAAHVPRPERDQLEAAAEGLARASGLLWMREFPDEEYLRYRLDKSLAGALTNQARIPAVTLEVGPCRIVDHASVATMVRAVIGICAHLNLVDSAPVDSDPRGPFRRGTTPRVNIDGILVPLVPPNQAFSRGQVIAEVREVGGKVRESIRADCPGVVVSWVEGAWVNQGATVGTLALEET
jgi:hypothetical protein